MITLSGTFKACESCDQTRFSACAVGLKMLERRWW
jgi:hypothetical protein